MTHLLYLTENDRGLERWRTEIAKIDPNITIHSLNDHYDPESIEVVLAWKPPAGIFPTLTQLKLIQSLGMGVDHLFKTADRPTQMPIARIIDPDMANQMSEYSLYGALTAFRNFHRYRASKTIGEWNPVPRNFHDEFAIGILGYGELGKTTVARLQQNGFPNIRIWSRTPKEIPSLKSYAGTEELLDFAKNLDLLICLLPLTSETESILNRTLFDQLNPGAYLINAARGEHLNSADLIEAIESKQIAGALLDVFAKEPLPKTDPLWTIPEIEITPHVAASTNPRTAAAQVVENIRRIEAGKTALNLIDLDRTY